MLSSRRLSLPRCVTSTRPLPEEAVPAIANPPLFPMGSRAADGAGPDRPPGGSGAGAPRDGSWKGLLQRAGRRWVRDGALRWVPVSCFVQPACGAGAP